MEMGDVLMLMFVLPLIVLVWVVIGTLVLWGLGEMFPDRFGTYAERARRLWNG